MVAEKPSVAKAIAQILSRRAKQQIQMMESKSLYNPVFQFQYPLSGQTKSKQILRVTSVTGHFLNFEYPESHKLWELDTIENLFSIKLLRNPTEFAANTVKNLKFQSKDVDQLILWLDCDREGESIAYDVIDLCSSHNKKIKQNKEN